MIKTRIVKFVGHIHNMQLCIEIISFINNEKDDFTIFVNQGISAFVLKVWSGEVNLRKSVAVISITDLHVMVTC